MRNLSSAPLLSALVGFVVLLCVPHGALAKIEAVQGKTYTLRKENGPWIIMVTSLWGETEQKYANAVKAADELVLELRKKGVPAYVYSQTSVKDHVQSFDRMGREQKRVYASHHDMTGVVAGNYPSANDPVAQKTLKFIKNFRPKVLKIPGIEPPAGSPGPLSKAFLTLNPMLSPEEIARKTRDPLLVHLNSGAENSLFENKGKYTLVVASFYGASQVKPRRFAEFDEKLKSSANLDTAALESWQLMKTMRTQGLEAYIYHDRHRSIVTVGAFDSPNDPLIAKATNAFMAKEKINPETKQPVLLAESIQIPGGQNGEAPLKSWTMDPYPELIEVPRK